MLKKLFTTNNDAGLALIRIALGVVMFPHGAQKVLGWYGGYGWSGTMGFMTWTLGVPALFGSLGLVSGLLGRVAAFGIFVNMLVAVAMVHGKVGFFMNWAGAQQGEGFE